MHLLTQEPLRTEFYLNNVFMYYVCMYLCIYVCVFIHAQLFVAPWTVGHQASLSMGFPRQEYWDGGRVVFAGSYPRGSSWLRIEPTSSESPALSGRFFTNTCTHTHTHTHMHTLMCVYVHMRIRFTIPQQTACGGLCYKQNPSYNQNNN